MEGKGDRVDKKIVSAAYEYDAVVVGAGPNGLAAAVGLAQHGFSTLVLERHKEIGGACRTEELTLPGFLHDVGSAVHPMALGSPFLSSLPLEKYGLGWCQPEIPLAHPIDQTGIATLRRSVNETGDALGKDAKAYRKLFEPIVSRWQSLMEEFLQPIIHLPRHPFQIATFASLALASIADLVRTGFTRAPAKALLAGLVARSFLPLPAPRSSVFLTLLGILVVAAD